jgi:hypothetical protein
LLKDDRTIRGGHYSDTARKKSKQNNSCTILVLFIKFSTIIVRKSLCDKMPVGVQSDRAMTGCSFQRRLLARLILMAIGTTIAIQLLRKN